MKDSQLDIPIDQNVKPVTQPMRRVPFSMRDKLEQKLNELVDLDVIERAEGPTPWISPVVVVPKPNGDIRLCVDMRQANGAIVRERHPIPTVDEVLRDLNGSTVFSKLDIKWAFHQVELSEVSRPITTFATHKGLFRYKRLMFEVSCAPEMYQRVIQQVLEGCDGVRNIHDDIIVHGQTTEEHDKRLEEAMERIQNRGLTLNREKCKFHMSELEFMGHSLSAQGIGPSQAIVEAVTEARQPESAAEVRNFLGLVNFCARFIPDLATVSEPLRRLTRKDVHFSWGKEQEVAFNELKKRLAKTETLGYFDSVAKTRVITDASPVGLGAFLVQEQNGEERVICYVSRSLTDVEKRYSQTEKEALGIVWACERLHMYLYGTDFEILTDHKPLQFIYSKKSQPSARVNRLVLRLQPYRFTVRHIPGKENIADSLSRLTRSKASADLSSEAEEYVRFVAENSTPQALSTREIERASDADQELSNVRKCVQTEMWHKLENKRYLLVRNELSVIGKLVLRRTRIIIPSSSRDQVLHLAHEGHPGIVSMKRRLRTKVWWPGCDKDAEMFCKTCYPCQMVSMSKPPEPLKRTELPSGPWQHISADLMTPSLPSGDHLLVVVDYYSRYMEEEVLRSTTADKVIASLRKIFLTHGLPVSITTDNGPQFISEEFRKFVEEERIEHRRVTPLWPQAHGEVETQNRSLLKSIKIAQIEMRNWKQELSSFLIMYRTTPHSTTGVSPAELLFRRKLPTRIPWIKEFPVGDQEVRDRDSEAKEKGKLYADEKRCARESDLKEGDTVLLRQERKHKLTPTFRPEPYRVLDKSGNSVVVESPDGVQYKRNSTNVKKFLERSNAPECEMSLSPPISNSATERQAQPSVNETDEHSGETHTQTVLGSAAEPDSVKDTATACRPIRSRTLPARFKDFVMS